MIIEGALAVKAVLESKRRHIHRLILEQSKRSKDINYMIALANQRKLTIDVVDALKIKELAQGKTHGGVLLECDARDYDTVDQLIESKAPRLVLIEGVEDPFNLGQMMRTIYVAGFDGVLLSHRDWSHVEATLLKSSAGAFERLMMIQMTDVAELKHLKAAGYTVAVTHRSPQSVAYQSYAYPTPLVLAIGGELRGLSRSVLELADDAIRIDYPSHVKLALNAVSACALLVFEAQRHSDLV